MAARSNLLSTDNLLRGATVLLLGLIAFIFIWLKSDVDELKKDGKELLKQANETRLELVKAIAAVERQAVATNSRLDQLIADGRKR